MKTSDDDLTGLKKNMVSKIPPSNEVPEKENNNFPIVGIGASAGGLETFELFFKNMPKNNGMAFVVVQHLDPTHAGLLPELLQRATTMKVMEASDNLKVKPNYIYVIPPNKSMTLVNGALHLFEPIETRGLRLPVDIFLRSLAEDRQEKSIGVILSGMGSDGSLGIKTIKEKNGIVLVQEPSTAKFDGMPRSAVQSIVPDIVAPVEELPARLIALLKHIPVSQSYQDIDFKSISNIDKIIILLRQQTGQDFSLYKKPTMFRRIERRKLVHQIDKIENYVRFCKENPEEVEILFKELLIGVTSFFRDPPVWELLKEKIFPELLDELPNGYALRAWVPGCSTGEEAYSIAIIFKEVLAKQKKIRNLTLQIFATDIDSEAIENARKGVFPSNIIADVSPERINQFFSVDGSNYRINTDIREMVVFATQNVVKDPPFTRLDILTCRNMLIYMEPELQRKIISLFNYSINPGGIMLLGTAETLGNSNEGFEILDPKLKFYKHNGSGNSHLKKQLIDFPSSFISPKRGITEAETETTQKSIENIQTIANQILLQRFTPASILVNEKGEIIYITGRTGEYLEPAAGEANWNIYAMAREDLRNKLPAAIQKTKQNNDPVILHNVKIGTNGGSKFLDVTVQRLESPELVKNMILLVFKEVPEVTEKGALNPKTENQSRQGGQYGLEIELQRSYEDLLSTREQMQTSQEELKSTNEELTTSKEEMQSMNEEMQSINIELQNRIRDFERANNDMENLLNSTEIAVLFLDKELNIRRFTDHVSKIFKLRSSDIGRPFTDLVSDLQYPKIESHARQVLKTLAFIETPIPTSDGRWYNVRIMPYRTIDDRIEGLVITFFNITLYKKLELELKNTNETLETKEKILQESEIHYHRLFEAAKEGILILNADSGMIMDVNPFLINLLGYSKEQFVEKAIWEIGFFKDVVANKDKFLELQQKEFVRYKNLPLETVDGKEINVEFVSNVYSVDDHKVIQCFIRDATMKKMDEGTA
ncbi:chemotaxis protein CheB [Flavobacterium psychrotolerans]|uniref:Chemotaxis protein CheB n=1 Tax=Flavobacterium psychrotolerans TaxID=2169410 RepID=A0A2U1JPS3_9FLAO|nr:chemotaxis protein CheB [Flavobacterium psychrotolerans]PWA07176.1 chemotaxis protein CheB [Flavobacterium psychrotolerans]